MSEKMEEKKPKQGGDGRRTCVYLKKEVAAAALAEVEARDWTMSRLVNEALKAFLRSNAEKAG